jgi:hypothetical protein
MTDVLPAQTELDPAILVAENDARRALSKVFPLYAEKILKIRTKAGEVLPFKVNGAQRTVHKLAEKQLRDTGKIRILLLKARQLGMSTLVEGRFFWRVTMRSGVKAFILTHHADATSNLFSMAKRFHELAPPFIVPEVGASSSREMIFPSIDSGYKVGTAGTEGIGRSETLQYFHGSEVAFWPQAELHAAGALQAVPDAPGTEVWLESTANGLGGLFHEMWQDAVRGQSDYLPIFLPWFDDPEYRRPVPEGFSITRDEEEYQTLYGLTAEQMVWRRAKIAELRSDWLFKQEYPATAEEAFQATGGDTLVSMIDVVRARKCEIKDLDLVGPLIIGVDPADGGKDRTAIVRRRGRKVYGIEVFDKMRAMELAGHLSMVIDVEKPRRVFLDKGGIGSPLYDRMLEMGYNKQMSAVNFGSNAMDRERYYNLRAEMWGKMAEWLADEPCDIPDDNALHADLGASFYTYTSNRAVQLLTKEQMWKQHGLRSPDLGDALALTFAYPVGGAERAGHGSGGRYRSRRPRQTTWMAA